MSNSRNTAKESVWASDRIDRYEDDDVVLPRIIERKPKQGDVHPLSKRVLGGALRSLPIEYLYGLDRIELQARKGKVVGDNPLGVYYVDEKAIILYSLPLKWELKSLSSERCGQLESWYAEVSGEEGRWEVLWPDVVFLGMWFFSEVLTHEIGHHFAEQYKNKRGRIRGLKYNEMNANLHAYRLTQEMFKRIRERRNKQAED